MARVVAAGVPHHITQRGNNRQDVFLLDDDRRFYLETLRERSQRHGVTLLGYCLMANHVHLVAIPERPDSLARALGQSHSRYAQGFNRRYGRTGHLWQNRFYSCPLGRTHLVRALLYVDLNPVRAGLVGRAQEYPWSSARAHTEGADPSGTLPQRDSLIRELAELQYRIPDPGSRPTGSDRFPRLRNAMGSHIDNLISGKKRTK